MHYSTTARTTYLAVFLFVVGIAASIVLAPPHGFSGPPPLSTLTVSLLFMGFHLGLLPLVSDLRAPVWARASGFGWIIFDNVLEIAALFGAGLAVVVPLRWGIHVACATWIGGTALQQRGVVRWVGVVAALALLITTFVGPYLGDLVTVAQSTGPSAVLFALWLVLSARGLTTRAQ